MIRALSAACLVVVVAAGTVSASHSRTVLHSFSGPEGVTPNALIQASDGYFYGTARYGGSGDGGTIYRMDLAGNVAVLHSFSRCDPAGYTPLGALIVGSDGRLYGTTSRGGQGNDCIGTADSRYGTVFSIGRSGGAVTVIHTFATVADGWQPSAGVIQGPDGALYGVTRIGGTVTSSKPEGRGVIFRVTTGGAFSVLHRLQMLEGQFPPAALIRASDGFLYGTTNEISASGASAGGSLFRLRPDGTSFSFVQVVGWQPRGQLVERGGWLYGVTERGGLYQHGLVFRYSLATRGFAVLHEFGFDGGYASTGMRPGDGLTLGRDGNFYGTATSGGLPVDSARYGVVFKMTPAGRLGVLQTFPGGTDGLNPFTRLVQGSTGWLYGTAMGGTAIHGIVYRANPAATGILSIVTAYPKEIIGGNATFGAKGWVILDGVAPVGGATVKLTSSKPRILHVPSTVTIDPGWSVVNYSITSSDVRRVQDATITAAYNGVTRTVIIRIDP
jgi:uncharacterized repeat protein (TIGR03803 family)